MLQLFTAMSLQPWHRYRFAFPALELLLVACMLCVATDAIDGNIENVELTRLHRKKYARVHGRLFDACDKYEDDEMTTTQLLREVSNITGLAPSTTNDAIYDEELQ